MTQLTGQSWGFIADAIQSVSPNVVFVSPSKGTVGSAIVITGAALTGALSVKFCSISQPMFTVVNDTTITTNAPQLALPPRSQICDVVVTKSGGSSTASSTSQFSYLPNVKSIIPVSGGVGAIATITGTSFLGATTVTLCGTTQSKFTVVNDTQIKWTVSDAGTTVLKTCDVVISTSTGRSSTSNSDAFTYAPQGVGGTTNHAPNAPTNSSKILYMTAAGIAAATLFVVAALMRQHDPEKKDERQFQAQEEPATNLPLLAPKAEVSTKYHACS